MATKNPNDTAADVYDFISAPLKGQAVVEQETALISSLVNPGGKILDIGCGSGRHAVVLAGIGFNVTGIDSSQGMLAVLQRKKSAVNIISADILTARIQQKFDLIIMMWNTFNEIALTPKNADLLLTICSSLLNPGGKILINSDDPASFDPEHLDFSLQTEVSGEQYQLRWRSVAYDHDNATSTAEETVSISKAGDNSRKRIITSRIIQRWWTHAQYQELACKHNLGCTLLSVPNSSELYVLMQGRS